MLDPEHKAPDSINDLVWAAHSYIRSVTLPNYPPNAEAQDAFFKLRAGPTIAQAKRRAV
jgi:hypothetical protein